MTHRVRRRVILDDSSDEDVQVGPTSPEMLKQFLSDDEEASSEVENVDESSSSMPSHRSKTSTNKSVSDLLADSMNNISLESPSMNKSEISINEENNSDVVEDSEDEVIENADRSRSFLEDKDSNQMSPISKRLSGKEDQISKQKLRERVLRKNAKLADQPTPDKRSSGASLQHSTLSPIVLSEHFGPNKAQGTACSTPTIHKKSSSLFTTSTTLKSDALATSTPMSMIARKRLDLGDEPVGPRSSASGSLASLPDDVRFNTPRKPKPDIIDLSSDSSEEDNDDSANDDGDNIDVDDGSIDVVEDSLNEDDAMGNADHSGDFVDAEAEEVEEEEEKDEAENEDEEEYYDEEQNELQSSAGRDVSVSIDDHANTSGIAPRSLSLFVICDDDNFTKQQLKSNHIEVGENIKKTSEIREAKMENIEKQIAHRELKDQHPGVPDSKLKENIAMFQKLLCTAASLSDKGEKLRQKIKSIEETIEFRNAKKKESEEIVVLDDSICVVEEVQKSPSPRKIAPLFKNRPGAPELIVLDENPEMQSRLDKAPATGENSNKTGTTRPLCFSSAVTDKTIRTLLSALETMPAESVIEESPRGLRVDLMPHQKSGLAWMLWREKQIPASGILADDMGLGKTLSMISLVLTQKIARHKRKEEGNTEDDKKIRDEARSNGLCPSNATLVVAPASLINQWDKEIERRVRPDLLRVNLFHGDKKKRESDPKRLARYDVVITTYQTLANELTERITTGHKGDSSDEEEDFGDEQATVQKARRRLVSKQDSVIAKINWARVILDEAHQIKNKNTSASKAVCLLSARTRWCLSGTPIHNNLWDLYSLIRFMQVAPFNEERHWKEYIMNNSNRSADRINLLVRNLLLRRSKEQTCSVTNKKLVDLKPKELIDHELELNGCEAAAYDILFQASRAKVREMMDEKDKESDLQRYGYHRRKPKNPQEEIRNPFLAGPRTIRPGDNFQQMSCVLTMLLRLRQACVHFHLTTNALDMDAFDGLDSDDDGDALERTMAGLTLDESISEEVKENVRDIFEQDYHSCKMTKLIEIVEDVMEKGDKIVIVSQWTSLLRLVEAHMKQRHFRFTIISGEIPVQQRQPRVDDFNRENGGVSIMLLSLTAGGVGLNLVGGNHLVMMDLHWNPALEAQACDRIYRMGQKKNVYVHRLITKDTIEQRVLRLQKNKLEMSGAVLEGAASKKNSKLTAADIKYLFDLSGDRAKPQKPEKTAP